MEFEVVKIIAEIRSKNGGGGMRKEEKRVSLSQAHIEIQKETYNNVLPNMWGFHNTRNQ